MFFDNGRLIFSRFQSPHSPGPKVVVKVFDKLTGGKRERDRVYQDGDEHIELQLRPGDAYEMNGVRYETASFVLPRIRKSLMISPLRKWILTDDFVLNLSKLADARVLQSLCPQGS